MKDQTGRNEIKKKDKVIFSIDNSIVFGVVVGFTAKQFRVKRVSDAYVNIVPTNKLRLMNDNFEIQNSEDYDHCKSLLCSDNNCKGC